MTEREITSSRKERGTVRENWTKAELARVGANYFIEASGKFSASTPCIAAELTLLCRGYGLPPRIIGSLLLVDNVQVDRIRQAANNAHAKHGKPPVEELVDPKVFIRENYALAERMTILSEDELIKILSRYEPGHGEEALREEVEEMVRVKRRVSRSLSPHK